MLSFAVLIFFIGIGAFVVGLNQISFFYSLTVDLKPLIYMYIKHNILISEYIASDITIIHVPTIKSAITR